MFDAIVDGLKYFSIASSVLIGVVALFGDFCEKDTKKLTRRGRLLASFILLSGAVTGLISVRKDRDDAERDKVALEIATRTASDADSARNVIEYVKLRGEAYLGEGASTTSLFKELKSSKPKPIIMPSGIAACSRYAYKLYGSPIETFLRQAYGFALWKRSESDKLTDSDLRNAFDESQVDKLTSVPSIVSTVFDPEYFDTRCSDYKANENVIMRQLAHTSLAQDVQFLRTRGSAKDYAGGIVAIHLYTLDVPGQFGRFNTIDPHEIVSNISNVGLIVSLYNGYDLSTTGQIVTKVATRRGVAIALRLKERSDQEL